MDESDLKMIEFVAGHTLALMFGDGLDELFDSRNGEDVPPRSDRLEALWSRGLQICVRCSELVKNDKNVIGHDEEGIPFELKKEYGDDEVICRLSREIYKNVKQMEDDLKQLKDTSPLLSCLRNDDDFRGIYKRYEDMSKDLAQYIPSPEQYSHLGEMAEIDSKEVQSSVYTPDGSNRADLNSLPRRTTRAEIVTECRGILSEIERLEGKLLTENPSDREITNELEQLREYCTYIINRMS